MNWREQQLLAIAEPVIFKQDYELLNFIKNSSYKQALAKGDSEYFGQAIELVDHGPVDFCIYIQNSRFDFYHLAENVNYIIKNELTSDALIYLAINKFHATAIKYSKNISDNYDLAIKQFVQQEINADIVSYLFQPDDRGSYFNFAHPLTRFYLKCNQK